MSHMRSQNASAAAIYSASTLDFDTVGPFYLARFCFCAQPRDPNRKIDYTNKIIETIKCHTVAQNIGHEDLGLSSDT